MTITMENVPKEKFEKIQTAMYEVLVQNGITDFDTIPVVDYLEMTVQGIVIKIDRPKSKSMFSPSSACG